MSMFLLGYLVTLSVYISLFHFLVAVGLYLHLAVSVVHEIKDALGIYCFRCGNLHVVLLFRKLLCFNS